MRLTDCHASTVTSAGPPDIHIPAALEFPLEWTFEPLPDAPRRVEIRPLALR